MSLITGRPQALGERVVAVDIIVKHSSTLVRLAGSYTLYHLTKEGGSDVVLVEPDLGHADDHLWL